MSATDQQLVTARPRIDPGQGAPALSSRAAPTARAKTNHLSGAQKAAIIVRVLLAEGLETPISTLPPDMQAHLTQTLGNMRLVDRATMSAVVEEFIETLEQVGLSFPDGLEGALSLLDGKLEEGAVRHLRALARGNAPQDPWTTLESADLDELIKVTMLESRVVGAVLLSKLSTDKAARLLMRLPPEHAQSLALAIARTEDIAPATVARIGATLAEQISARPQRAFSAPPSRRMGEILNSSPAAMRESLLARLEAEDQGFASGVRKSIFTYRDIPVRVARQDVPTIMREVSGEDLMVIIAASLPEDVAATEFLLGNMSKRMADTLREDAADQPPPSSDVHESASARIAGTVRSLSDAAAITLLPAQGPG